MISQKHAATKRKNTVKKTFCDLPPRVVIHEILARYIYDVQSMEDSIPNKYTLFGYFKLDGLRHIWFVFSSLKLTHELTVFIDCERTVTLILLNPFNSLLKRLIKVSPRMRSLEALWVRFCDDEVDIMEIARDTIKVDGEGRNLFSVPNCFPNLLHFDFESGMNSIEHNILMHDWRVAEPNFFPSEKLRRIKFENDMIYELDLVTLNDIGHPNITPNNVKNIFHDISKNLKHLELNFFFAPETVILEIPNLEILDISCCSKVLFEVKARSNLKILKWETDDIMTEENLTAQNKNMEAIYRKSTKLKSIEFSWFGTPSLNLESWLLNPIANPLLHLESLSIYSSRSVNADYLKSSSRFGKKLQILNLNIHTAEYDEDVFFQEYPTLKIVKLRNTPEVTKRWRIMDHVEELCLKNSDNLSDDFFNLNEFKNLEMLVIKNVPKIEGFLKNEMEKVRTFGGMDLNISDVMFQVAFGASLRKLVLRGCPTLRGQNWRSEAMSGLEELEIIKCENFDHLDDLFIKNEFKRLQMLNLVETRFVSGKDWNAFPVLESLTILKAPLLSPDLFTTGKLEKLKYLHIAIVNSIGWSGLGVEPMQWRTPSLVEFRTNERESFGEFLEGKKGLPKNCKVIIDGK